MIRLTEKLIDSPPGANDATDMEGPMHILLTLPFDADYKWSAPDLGLGYLAAALRQHGHTVELCLRPNRFHSAGGWLHFLAQGAYDLVGIKTFSCQLRNTRATIACVREALPQAVVIVGGPHVSADPQRAFSYLPEADYALQGEGEVGLPVLVDALAAGTVSSDTLASIPGLIWRGGQRTVWNPVCRVQQLDDIPFPAWDLMPPASFPERPMNGYSRRQPIAPMLMTRGCPYGCTFCNARRLNGRSIRSRSPENVLAELRLLSGIHGVREIQFYDSNCAAPQGPLRDVLRGIIAEKIDITWCAPNGIRLDSVDRELVYLMRRSGCFQVNVGIESGSPRILRQIGKSLSLDTVHRATELLAGAGIETVGFFMLGFPGETRAEIRETVDLALRLPLTGASFSIYCPLPGTDDYERLLAHGGLTIESVDAFDMVSYDNDLSEMSAQELREAQRRAYLRFHLRPKIVRALLRNLTSLDKLRFLAVQAWEKAMG